MKRAVLLLVAACQATPGDDYPIGPGGGGPIGGGPGGGDAGTGDATDAGGIPLRGRVCMISDLRHPTVCDNTQRAGGLRVSLGTRTTTTSDDLGTFQINAPQGGGFTWHVENATDQRIVRTAMPFGTDNTIPVIDFERYAQLLETNSAAVGSLQGSIVVRVVNGSASLRGITASLAGFEQVLYDGTSSVDWKITVGTGDAGVVWLPGVTTLTPAGPVTVQVRPPGTAVATPVQATVEDQTITFVTADLQ